jgi:hypothetical protein
LAEGFISRGYPCVVHNGYLEYDSLIQWLIEMDATLCLEVNHSPPNSVRWPQHITHATWICDYRVDGRSIKDLLGLSNHYYFLIHPTAFGIVPPKECPWSMLLPSVSPNLPDLAAVEFVRDFSMAGFIPPPLSDNSPISVMPNGRIISIAEFTSVFPIELWSQSKISLPSIHKAIDETCDKIGCKRIVDESILYVLDELIPRTNDRRTILNLVKNISHSIDIFGPDTWLKWQEFAPFYKGFVSEQNQLDQIFRSTRINLHNSGLSMHFRVLDCMAAGGFILVNETPLDYLPGGILNYLQPAMHYGSYTNAGIEEVARYYLAEAGERNMIALRARDEVLRSHTHAHRAGQILADFGLPQQREEFDIRGKIVEIYKSKDRALYLH